MNWIDEITKINQNPDDILSFEDYMDIFEKNSHRELRTTSMYLKDMFSYFGKTEDGHYQLFQNEFPDSPAIAGQKRTQSEIYKNLINFCEEGFTNKFILLVGPNGSSKSSVVKKIMKSAEVYSHADEGALYTFNWIFPNDHYVKGSVGFSKNERKNKLGTFAYLEDREISAILPSELKDHPILLIPLETRQDMINRLLKDRPEVLESVQKSYIYNGDLSKRNRMIFDALLKSHKGEITEVLKYIRVERFHIDKRYSIGATTIEPQLHVDAKMQQITMDKRLASLPPSLQSLNLFSVNGEMIQANRGVLEFSDLLKRPLDTYKYLLMTMETKSINMQGIPTELDIFFIGSSNEIHFDAFKQHPDYKSFKGRFNFIRVPYLLNFEQEEKIYKEQITNLKDRTSFEPHSITALCQWAVMTRLRQPQEKNYQDKKLAQITAKLTPIEKASFFTYNIMPDYLSSEEKQILNLGKEQVESEFLNDPLYEGKFGISPREMKQIIYELATENKSVGFIEVLEHLKALSTKRDEFDFLQIGAQADYHNSKKFIYLVEQYSLNTFDNEVRECLGLVDNRSYEEYVEKYVTNIKAILKNEKIRNKVTAKYEEGDLYFIKEFESNIHLKESPDDFRSHVISKLGAYSLDNPGKPIIYTEVLTDIVKLLKESFRNEQKKIIIKVASNLVFYTQDKYYEEQGKGKQSGINPDAKDLIDSIVNNLKERFSYSEKGAINHLQYLIKKRYDTSNS